LLLVSLFCSMTASPHIQQATIIPLYIRITNTHIVLTYCKCARCLHMSIHSKYCNIYNTLQILRCTALLFSSLVTYLTYFVCYIISQDHNIIQQAPSACIAPCMTPSVVTGSRSLGCLRLRLRLRLRLQTVTPA
jgi:hypothetical protein